MLVDGQEESDFVCEENSSADNVYFFYLTIPFYKKKKY